MKRGQKLAALEELGDKSYAKPHLHFGVKEVATDKYLDPESLLPPIVLGAGSSEAQPVIESQAIASESSLAASVVIPSNLSGGQAALPLPTLSGQNESLVASSTALKVSKSVVEQSAGYSKQRQIDLSNETASKTTSRGQQKPQNILLNSWMPGSFQLRGQQLWPRSIFQLPANGLLFESSGSNNHSGELYPLPGSKALGVFVALMAFLSAAVLVGLALKRNMKDQLSFGDTCLSTS